MEKKQLKIKQEDLSTPERAQELRLQEEKYQPREVVYHTPAPVKLEEEESELPHRVLRALLVPKQRLNTRLHKPQLPKRTKPSFKVIPPTPPPITPKYKGYRSFEV